MDPPDAPNDNFAHVQQTRDLDSAHDLSVESAIFDER